MAQASRDPVCGMDVDPSRAAAQVEHEGTTYSFCSQGCAKKFRANPNHFLNARQKGASEHAQGEKADSYLPLAIIIGLIVLVTATLAHKDWQRGEFAAEKALAHFMAGFFLVFAGFKLIDLKGFAEAYSTYDLLAKHVPAYGYVYPFIELGFGLAMMVIPTSRPLLVAEIVVMAFSGLGVAIKLAKRERFRCACLGTFLKVPLTKVTLVEDFGMAALGAAMLALA